MNTYRITEKDINGMNPLAVGYKIFKHDWTANGGYDYKDENGNVLGTIHKVDGNIEECRWGLHFSEKPQDCFNFYECVQWNKFAKVEAYGKVIKGEKKSVAQILKIVETYSFNEFIRFIQEDLQKAVPAGVNVSNGVNDSNGVNGSTGVNGSRGVSVSYGVNVSKGVNDSNGVNGSRGVNVSNGVNDSNGVNGSKGVNGSYGIVRCEGISRSIFCYKKTGKLMLFNKKTTEERFSEVYDCIKAFGWFPRFNNAEALKGNLEWYETNIPAIVGVDRKTAWSSMPQEMKEYIQNLPEYDEKIFNIITGIAEEEEDER